MMTINNYTVRIYDGNYTSIYTTQGRTTEEVEKKIIEYHQALGGKVVKTTTTQRG